MREIVFSKLNPEKVARTMDNFLDLRDEYFRDQTKIIHSLPFRRLKHKTQVFFAPDIESAALHIGQYPLPDSRGLFPR